MKNPTKPRIDPQQLLRCLSVLLSPKGGIKSKDEVQRLASLMTKFSKKLVSKCIYVSILKATETDLLIMFMSAGGWDLTYTWLSDGVVAKNWPLVQELVELLLICPVDIDRLKTNACPKLIKTLSKDTTTDENVRLLACQLVEQWLRVVRGDNDPSLPTTAATATTTDTEENTAVQQENGSEGHLPVYKITIRDGEKVLAKISGGRSSTEAVDEGCSTPTSSDDVNQDEEEPADVSVNDDDDDEDYDEIKPVKLKKKPQLNKTSKQANKKPAKVSNAAKKERDSTDSASSSHSKPNKLKENTKLAGKKEKNESPKVKPTSKKSSNSPKMSKEGLSAESDVARSKKSDESSSNLKQKGKLSLSLKNKKQPPSIKDKKDPKSEKNDVKEKNVLDDDDSLTEKEKESIKKLIAPPISKLGKIPKKTSSSKEEKQSEEKNRTLKEDNSDGKVDVKKGYDVKKPETKRLEKNFTIGVDRKAAAQGEKPKTVKTYNSKFRSTGLEEEVKPPPPRPVNKKPPPPLFPGPLVLPEKKIGKRMSPPPEPHLPEKKLKPDSPQEEKKPVEKSGGIKLIPPKPKPMFLQESDVFMDAMLEANKMKEPRKRKRKGSVSREGPSDPKKDAQDHKSSPSNSPKSEDSPSSLKPTFKFYQDTLETSMEEEKADKDDENLEFAEPDKSSDDLGDDQKSMSSTDDEKVNVRVGQNGPLKGVLVHLKSRRQKKSVTWKEDSLETIKYFELDETERVNVTKNFSDMKLMEREHERENFQLVRKLAVDDVMEEKTRWRALIPIDIAAPVVAPGKNSQEKEIQYAREKTVPAAIYFNKRMIPDAPAEPDLEIHATTDPACIPLEDITGSTDSINDFTTTPWPEPKGPAPLPVPPPAPAAVIPATPFPPTPVPAPGPGPNFPGPFPPMGPGAPFMPPGPPMGPGNDCWRTGDGKVVAMPGDMMMGPPQPLMGPPGMPMGPGPMMLPPGVTPEMGPFPMMGPNPTMPEEMHFPGGFPQMPGPPFPPGPPVPQGPPQGWQGGNNWYNDGDQPPPHHNQSNGPPHRGNNWRGRGGRNPDGSWGGGGGGNSRMPICNNFLKKGFCRNNSCRFRHPRN
ncbi:serine/threonine-protein phosphatase 1 regulatory subunit 10-like isoform X2 [Macrosteles quadrilineatus]|uniref:serine/threonine-protein phosphatase 1 regulatory subunit 10-like isoform X2 n=1 Tax=Macrosteles quadrilineatus TaxID=74068 RepID=UPI0023E308B0|nr:serine/threonine-protein phosphatase 1 regulatory subunit 10-like isoform X2 [Macrosteles quadrilineatus]